MLVKMEVPDAEVWSSIFGSNFSLYSWWRSVEFITGAWDTPGVVKLMIDHPDYPELSGTWADRLVDLKRLEWAINEGVAAGQVPNDVDAWDSADVADNILQIAVLGDIFYG